MCSSNFVMSMMSFLYRPSRRVFASVVLLLLGFGLCACTGNKSGRISVAVTIPPLQNWAEQLAGGRVDIVCAVPDGGNPESYDLPPSAMVGLSKCSLYFSCGYLGFERSWLGKLSENNPELQIVDLSEGSELLYGTHHHEEGHHHDGEAYPDPHIWCSPRLARRMVEMMYRSLTEIDPDGASTYAENYARIDRRFAQLDSVLTDKLRPFKGKAFAVYHPTLSYCCRLRPSPTCARTRWKISVAAIFAGDGRFGTSCGSGSRLYTAGV